MAAVLPGLFALILGGIILVYGIASGGIDHVSFSNPYVVLGGVFLAIGLTVLLIAPQSK
jgi:hypothetical protein